MKSYRIYFIDKDGHGGEMIWRNKKKLTEVKKGVKQYIRLWDLAPITDLKIEEVEE